MHDQVIVLNSRVAFEGTDNANQKYQFDFTNWERGMYKVELSYVGETNDLNADKTCSIYTNLGSTLVYSAGAETASQTSTYLGTLKPRNVASGAKSTYLSCDHNDNAPICLQTPRSNVINIQMRDGNNAVYTDSVGDELANYILTLRFTKV
tara:strand:- start:8796 stop:9248 length:453 start_codon:yes stop_codon:yes gene_type:complete